MSSQGQLRSTGWFSRCQRCHSLDLKFRWKADRPAAACTISAASVLRGAWCGEATSTRLHTRLSSPFFVPLIAPPLSLCFSSTTLPIVLLPLHDTTWKRRTGPRNKPSKTASTSTPQANWRARSWIIPCCPRCKPTSNDPIQSPNFKERGPSISTDKTLTKSCPLVFRSGPTFQRQPRKPGPAACWSPSQESPPTPTHWSPDRSAVPPVAGAPLGTEGGGEG